MITFLLVSSGVLQQPLLYLSYYLKKHRSEYYELLNKVRFKGAWEEWIKFFLKGVYEVSQQATDTANNIVKLQNYDHDRLSDDANALKLLDYLYTNPMVTTNTIQEVLDVSASTANRLVSKLENMSILEEVTGYTRNRRFVYREYMNTLHEGVEF